MTDVLTLLNLKPKVVPVFDLDGNEVGKLELPLIFSYPVRHDIIRRAFHSAHTARLQPKGRDPMAGKRRAGESWGAGHSVARVPRLDTGRAVFAPMTRGGRLTHPPRVEKVIHERINKKERIIAIVSALAATAEKEFVVRRGHVVPVDTVPVVVDNKIEEVDRVAEAREILKNLKLWDDVVRAQRKTRIRAGKGKMRGRRYVTPKSILIVVSRLDAPAIKAFRNLPGVDVVVADMLSVLHLAPGGVPGRLTLYSKSAIDVLKEKYEVATP